MAVPQKCLCERDCTRHVPETHNKHFLWVLTLVDSFPKSLLVLRFTSLRSETGAFTHYLLLLMVDILHCLESLDPLASWTNRFETRRSIGVSPGAAECSQSLLSSRQRTCHWGPPTSPLHLVPMLDLMICLSIPVHRSLAPPDVSVRK